MLTYHSDREVEKFKELFDILNEPALGLEWEDILRPRPIIFEGCQMWVERYVESYPLISHSLIDSSYVSLKRRYDLFINWQKLIIAAYR